MSKRKAFATLTLLQTAELSTAADALKVLIVHTPAVDQTADSHSAFSSRDNAIGS